MCSDNTFPPHGESVIRCINNALIVLTRITMTNLIYQKILHYRGNRDNQPVYDPIKSHNKGASPLVDDSIVLLSTSLRHGTVTYSRPGVGGSIATMTWPVAAAWLLASGWAALISALLFRSVTPVTTSCRHSDRFQHGQVAMPHFIP